MNEEIKNPFAIVLAFYANFIRNKLNATDLERIAKQFRLKPEVMLTKMREKYPYFHIPDHISCMDLKRYLAIFDVPSSYRLLLIDCNSVLSTVPDYKPTLDVWSNTFNAEIALFEKTVFISSSTLQLYDNLSKVTHLLPSLEGSQLSNTHIQVPSSSASTTSFTKPPTNLSSTQPQQVTKPIGEDRRHYFEIIAEIATPPAKFQNTLGESIDMNSPLQLIYQFMKEKQRVRIIIRRNLSVRGSMDAYIKAFDRYCNVLLYDIDEEYITNQQRKRTMTVGKFVNQHNVLHRHLPQLLVRGDTIVCIFRKPCS